jgi:hypothetical protein
MINKAHKSILLRSGVPKGVCTAARHGKTNNKPEKTKKRKASLKMLSS